MVKLPIKDREIEMDHRPTCPKCGSSTYLTTTMVSLGEGVEIGGPGFRCSNFDCYHLFTTPDQVQTTRENGESLMQMLRSGNFDL